jgi:DNA mismatch repair ATPase MutS
MLSPLFQDLDRLLTQVAQPVAQALKRYVKTGSGSLAALEYELAFYVAAVGLIRRLAARGVRFCQPEIAPVEERVIQIGDLVNISLALKNENPVASHAEFGTEGRIAILTGPNSGGKTTYLRSLGLTQVLFQAGLFVPASRARISPVDAILTHFPALETRQQGRLAEEAVRLREIFQQCTRHSLVLLNETFSSTASGEALYLAQDILAALRTIGARAIFATHLTELAEHLDDIEASIAGDSRLFGLIAGVKLNDDGQATATFEIKRGKPLGRSYAQEIARRHGISLEQILQARESGRSR